MVKDTSKRHKRMGPQPPPHRLRHLISVAKEKGRMEVPGRAAGLGPPEPSSRREASLQVGSGKGGGPQSLPHWMMEGSGTNGDARTLLEPIWDNSTFSGSPTPWGGSPSCPSRKGTPSHNKKRTLS